MITTVVFDLDDTLYDEIEYCKSGFTSVAGFVAGLRPGSEVKQIYDAFWRQFTAGNRTKTFNTALEQLGISYNDKLIEELIRVYRNHIPKITLPKDSRDVLNQLMDKYALALLTDGYLPAQRLKVKALGIEKYFKCVIYTEELGRDCWKPSPAGFKKLMQTLNTRSENMAYVADNQEKDFIAPNKLGFTTVQIIRPARIHTLTSQQPDAVPQYIIHKIGELPALLEKL